MIKKGFTLLEILLTLAIMGVLAAVLLRCIAAAMPDAGKAKFLKAYSATRTVVAEMINDSSLYPDTSEFLEDGSVNPNYGFANTTKPVYGLYSDEDFSGDCKFANIFADRLNLIGSSCDSWYVSRREGVEYLLPKVNKLTSDFQIRIAPKGKTNDSEMILGGINVTIDGDVTCVNASLIAEDNHRKYCENMLDLRQGAGED